MSETLGLVGDLKELARKHKDARDFLFLGRGSNYPIGAGRCASSRRSRTSTRGLAAGEMKHGPIALIDDGLPVVIHRDQGQRLRQSAVQLG